MEGSMEPELIETDIKTKKNPIQGLGQYAITGGPGRPKGCLNKLTRLKEKLLKVASQEQIEEIYREFCKGSKIDKLEALKIFVSMLPKETQSKVDMDVSVGPKVIIIREVKGNPKVTEGEVINDTK
jgi:hypothetical protein